jgi:hypothetical protein
MNAEYAEEEGLPVPWREWSGRSREGTDSAAPECLYYRVLGWGHHRWPQPYRFSSDLDLGMATLPHIPGTHGEQTVALATRSTVNEPLDVSMIQLIARPDDFDGEYVRVIGFYRHEFEGNALYLHREDYEQGLTKNGLWMDGAGMWSGEIAAVTRAVPRKSIAAAEE